MAGDVRRASSQWHAADGAPAGGFAPPGPPHLPRTARTGAHRRYAVTGGHTDASACAPEAGTVCTAVADVATRDVTLWTRSGAQGEILFPDSIFKFVFLQFHKLNYTLVSEAKLEIRDSSTTFTKACRDLVQGMKQERHANMAEISAPVNRSTTASKACFTTNSSEFQMPLNSKVVSPNILHIFHFGWFWSV
jgi:hypothetical protein